VARDAVAEIRERIDIVDLIQGYVPSLKRAGRSMKGLCPFHQEKTPSFVVFPESQNFHCFGCGKSGDLFTFYMLVEHVEFREALQELANRAGVTLDFTAPVTPEHDAHRQKLLEVNGLAATWFAHQLRQSHLGAAGREVVEQRGISPEMVEAFGLGFAPDKWDGLLTWLNSRSISSELAMEAGLVTQRQSGDGYFDKFRNRLIFPIRDRDGNVLGFGGRALGDAIPKYLNSPQTPVFDKSSIVYGLDLAKEAIRTSEEVVIVEGYMDVITAHQFGYTNVVGAMGTALTEGQVAQIKRAGKRIVLALDADTAGQMATIRGLDTVRESLGDTDPVPDALGIIRFEKRLRAEIRIAQLPAAKDPDELIRKNPESWPGIIKGARPFLDFMIDVLTRDVDQDDAHAKSQVIQSLAPALQQVADRIVQGHYVTLVARKLDLEYAEVLSVVRGSALAKRASTMRSVKKGEALLPERKSTEDFLVALLLRHHALTMDVVSRVPVESLIDVRNREIVRLLQELDQADISAEEILNLLDDGVIEHAQALLLHLDGQPEEFPGRIGSEASKVLEKLGKERFQFLIKQLNHNLQTALRDQDQEAIDQMLSQMSRLGEQHRQFDPPVSPYFRDSRTPTHS